MAQPDEQELDKEGFGGCGAVGEVGLVAEAHRGIEELGVEECALGGHGGAGLVVGVEEVDGLGVAGYHKVAEVGCEAVDEEEGVEAAVAHLLVDEEGGGDVAGAEGVEEAGVVALVEDVQRLDGGAVGYVAAGGGGNLVENREGVAHGSVGLAGYHAEGGALGLYPLALSDVGQMVGDVADGNAGEVVNLAAGEYRRDDLVFLGCREDEDDIGGGFLKGFEERVEGGGGEHVYLVDDEDAVLPFGRGNLHLVCQ